MICLPTGMPSCVALNYATDRPPCSLNVDVFPLSSLAEASADVSASDRLRVALGPVMIPNSAETLLHNHAKAYSIRFGIPHQPKQFDIP